VAAPSLRPLGVGETLDVAIKIYTRNAGTLLRLVFVIAAPITLLSTTVEASAVSSTNVVTFDDTGQISTHSGFWTAVAALLVAVLLLPKVGGVTDDLRGERFLEMLVAAKRDR